MLYRMPDFCRMIVCVCLIRLVLTIEHYIPHRKINNPRQYRISITCNVFITNLLIFIIDWCLSVFISFIVAVQLHTDHNSSSLLLSFISYFISEPVGFFSLYFSVHPLLWVWLSHSSSVGNKILVLLKLQHVGSRHATVSCSKFILDWLKSWWCQGADGEREREWHDYHDQAEVCICMCMKEGARWGGFSLKKKKNDPVPQFFCSVGSFFFFKFLRDLCTHEVPVRMSHLHSWSACTREIFHSCECWWLFITCTFLFIQWYHLHRPQYCHLHPPSWSCMLRLFMIIFPCFIF